MTGREERDIARRLARPDEVSDEVLASQDGRMARFAIEQRLRKTARKQKLARVLKKHTKRKK